MDAGYGYLLCVGAVGLYVFDSAMILYRNEFAMSYGADSWRVLWPFATEMNRRRLCIPNPVTPHRPLMRLHWHPGPAEMGPNRSQDGFLQALLPVQLGVSLLLAVVLSGLPIVFLTGGSPVGLLAWMAAAYATVIGVLVTIYWRRKQFGLSSAKVGWLALESLACVPMAINLVRRLTQEFNHRSVAIPFAASNLPADQTNALLEDIDRVTRNLLVDLDIDSDSYNRLTGFRQRLEQIRR